MAVCVRETCKVAHSSDCRSLNWILSEVLWMHDW